MSKIAFIYPGQGAQKIGMGKDFYEKSESARNIYDKASDLLGLDMKALCFEDNDKLDITEYTQPALVTTCLAITKVVLEQGITPQVCAGLSLGEYAAIAVSGGISYLDAIATVRKRGILMQEAVPDGKGAMAAVLGLDAETIEEVISSIEEVSIANYNCPGQIVITGMKSGVEAAAEKLKEAKAKRVLMLNVSGPFHSPFLKTAGDELMKVLETIKFQELAVPYVSNTTADYISDIKQTPQLLKKQVSAPVKWQQSVETMIKNGVDTFIEIGPGKTLAGFIKKINKEVKVYNVGTMEEAEGIAEHVKG